MLRRASTALFCALALVAPAFGQDVFVPRELKAIPVHPPKPKEVVRRAEPVAEGDLKPAKETASSSESAKPKAPKAETATVKTEKITPKEKAPAITEEAASKKTAKAEPAREKSEKPAASKEKPTVAKAPPATDEVATIKVEKSAAKEPAAKTVAKADPAKDKKEKAAPAKDDSELPTIKVEKVAASKEPAKKTVAKTETAKPEPASDKSEKATPAKEKAASESVAKTAPAKSDTTVAKSEKAATKEEPAHKSVAKTDSVKVETVTAKTEKPAVKEKPATVAVTKSLKEEKGPAKDEAKASKNDPVKMDVTVAKTEKPAVKEKQKEKTAPPAAKPPAKSEALIAKVEPAPPREGPANPAKVLPVRAEQVFIPTQKDPPQVIPAVSGTLDTGFTKVADGFDFPVGKPEAEGYYKARGFRPGGHVGEDWDGTRGGDTDLRDPIYSIGDGIVVFARDVHLGWGNVIIVRHAYRENGDVRYIDALYGHLNNMMVARGQRVTRGQQIGTMGTAHGQYDAHLHFEIRKNLEIGMSRSKFQKSFSNYYDPTQFINSHRRLSGGGANYKVAMNTFTHDWMYNFDKNRNFGARKRSTGESSAALRRAVTTR
jgi:murein DD-endopeptidase MepM/ murein hydrolase activator NlpD